MWRFCRYFCRDACHDTHLPESARDARTPSKLHALIWEISRVVDILLNMQVAGEMAAAGLKRMIDGYNREKECSDLAEPKGFICVSSTGFAGGAPTPDLSGMSP